MRTLGIILFCALALSAAAPALGMSVDQVPNPQRTDGTWVSDTASVISAHEERFLNTTIDDLEAKTGAEIAVVTVNTVDAPTPKDFATELFNHWGIGKAGDDSGLLVLLVLDERRVEMETGYGLEGVLTDGWLKRMQQDEMVPAFKNGWGGSSGGGGAGSSFDRQALHRQSDDGPYGERARVERAARSFIWQRTTPPA